jgi:hypothetical protein
MINNVAANVTKIEEDQQLQRPTKPILGSNGSHTTFLGKGGRLLTLTIRANENNIQAFQNLAALESSVTVISQSMADYNGIYNITSYKPSEDKRGVFHITMTLQENYVFNVTMGSFTDNQVSPVDSSTVISVGEKWDVAVNG